MRPLFKRLAPAAAVAALCAVAVGGLAVAATDLGLQLQAEVRDHSQQSFGIDKPLTASSTTNIDQATALADPTKLVTLAKPLKAKTVAVVASAPNIDQMALWPDDMHPTHIVTCNEQGSAQVGLIRVKIADGSSETIVSQGLTSCDPVRRTPWGTILFGEENGTSGRLFEMVDPLHTTNVVVALDGSTSGGTGAANIVMRSAMGRLSFEGLAVYPNGVIYFGDELRPAVGVAGGAYFKFIPTTLRTGSAPVVSLSGSPLVAGTVYGMRLGDLGGGDSGQGTQTGLGKWLDTTASGFPSLRSAAGALKLTGYYRPEDADIDRAALAAGNVRFCGNNTGNEGPSGIAPLTNGHTYGETICITDGTLAQAGTPTSVPEVQFLVLGNPQFSMMDNIAYQPGRGNWVIHEDGEERAGHNDLWDCTDDGQDDDLLADGCIRIASLNDGFGNPGGDAEWTGGIFSGDGNHFYVSVQHNVSGKGVILDITGWKGGDDDHGHDHDH